MRKYDIPDNDIAFVKKIFFESQDFKLRKQAQAVLLYLDGKSVTDIAKIMSVHRETITTWLMNSSILLQHLDKKPDNKSKIG